MQSLFSPLMVTSRPFGGPRSLLLAHDAFNDHAVANCHNAAKEKKPPTNRVRWCSWLSRELHTLKVLSSNLGRINSFAFLRPHFEHIFLLMRSSSPLSLLLMEDSLFWKLVA